MRRPNRIIEIFSMSVLDMFASALGAFILIAVLLFPYFNKHQQLELVKKEKEAIEEKLAIADAALKQRQEESQALQKQIDGGADFQTALVACMQTMAACQAKASKVFLVIGIEWEEPCDVDLYVTDPNGREFSYRSKTFPGSRAELSIDMQFGPGVEVWQNPEAETGDYKVRYQTGGSCPALRADQGVVASVAVKGWVLDRGAGLQPLPTKGASSLSAVDVAVIHVGEDGLAKIR